MELGKKFKSKKYMDNLPENYALKVFKDQQLNRRLLIVVVVGFILLLLLLCGIYLKLVDMNAALLRLVKVVSTLR